MPVEAVHEDAAAPDNDFRRIIRKAWTNTGRDVNNPRFAKLRDKRVGAGKKLRRPAQAGGAVIVIFYDCRANRKTVLRPWHDGERNARIDEPHRPA